MRAEAVLAPRFLLWPPGLIAFVSKKVPEPLTTETMHTFEGEMLFFLVLPPTLCLLQEILLYFRCLVC